MTTINFAELLSQPPNERECAALERRIARLNAMKTSVNSALESLDRIQAAGRRQVKQIYIRRDFAFRAHPAPGDVSDRRLPPRADRPPATRIMSPRGTALRTYLIALFEAQTRCSAGTHPTNDRPLRARGEAVGWVDLVAPRAPVTSPDSRYAGITDKKLRQLQDALARLSHPEVQLVSLSGPGSATGRYEGFQLLDEAGARKHGDPAPYVVPHRRDADVFTLPASLFTNGWVHVLEDTELAFLLMLALCRAAVGEKQVAIPEAMRLLNFGLGRDAYAAYELLKRLNLIEVEVDQQRHTDGKVIDYGKGGEARLHRFKLLDDGFEELAIPSVLKVLGDRLARGRSDG
jgi:hypothetical protein